ncbi:MAG TPA: cytochrome c biogenesis protein ResB [Candidatus Hydrogenedentes bacterium]|nr:cytochrome c biogenesis protein ResB [Candidatus Hydrogenedentota bacterium]
MKSPTHGLRALLATGFRILASYGLSVILLTLLLVLVFIGTIEQVRIGLYPAQQRYFESFIAIFPLFGSIPLPLPGGYLLITLILINMLCGAMIRAPKNLRRPGLLIAHAGVLLLGVWGFVTYHYAITGYVDLYEGESASTFRDYQDWELRITELNPREPGPNQYVTHHRDFDDGRPGKPVLLRHARLPFTLAVQRWLPNARPAQDAGPDSVEGVTLVPQPPAPEPSGNLPGVILSINGASPSRGLAWAGERAPLVLDTGDRQFRVDLAPREWPLPFTIRLLRFRHETHPGTAMPSHFSSRVEIQEGDTTREVEIRMNEPLRHRNHVLYQASWGPQDAGPGARLYSVLSVSRNPAGEWALYASLIITAGLLLHYAQVFRDFLRKSVGRTAS